MTDTSFSSCHSLRLILAVFHQARDHKATQTYTVRVCTTFVPPTTNPIIISTPPFYPSLHPYYSIIVSIPPYGHHVPLLLLPPSLLPITSPPTTNPTIISIPPY